MAGTSAEDQSTEDGRGSGITVGIGTTVSPHDYSNDVTDLRNALSRRTRGFKTPNQAQAEYSQSSFQALRLQVETALLATHLPSG